MDVKNMTFEDNMFDVIIDKALIDTLITYNDNVNRISNMMCEVIKKLKCNGLFYLITFSDKNLITTLITKHKNNNFFPLKLIKKFFLKKRLKNFRFESDINLFILRKKNVSFDKKKFPKLKII